MTRNYCYMYILRKLFGLNGRSILTKAGAVELGALGTFVGGGGGVFAPFFGFFWTQMTPIRYPAAITDVTFFRSSSALALSCQELIWSQFGAYHWDIPSGYVKIAIEHGNL